MSLCSLRKTTGIGMNGTMEKQRRLGVVLQYVQMTLQILITLIFTPIMLRILGKNEYGLYSFASSVIAYLSLMSLGFGASYIRFYTRCKSSSDKDGIKKLNGLYLLVFFILGLICLIAGLTMASNVRIFLNDSYSENDIHIARFLMAFLSINLAISFPASVFASYITSHERFVFQKIVNIGKTILSPTMWATMLFMGYGSRGMVVATTIIALIVDSINISYCIGKLKMRFSFRNLDFGLLKEIAGFSVFIAINQIVDQINWQMDKFVLGKIINATAVSIYSVAATINTMYLNLSSAVSSVFAPKVHRIVNSKDPNTDGLLTDIFIKVGRIQYYVLMLILTGFIFFGKPFISKWAGEGYELAYNIVLLLIAPATISLIQNIGIEIQNAKNKHQFRSIVYLIMAFMNVGISILFCHLWGTVGVAIGTTISLVFANGLIMNIYYQKKLGINVIEFWKQILRISLSMLPAIAFGIFLMMFYTFHSALDYFIMVILYAIIYCAFIFFFGMNKNEKNMILTPFKKIFRKFKKNT